MGGWMDGRVDGWMDGWVGGWMLGSRLRRENPNKDPEVTILKEDKYLHAKASSL
jgi:hypothetical protein